MKSIVTLAAIALLSVSAANAQTSTAAQKQAADSKIVSECAAKQTQNAAIIAKAQAAATPAERASILKAAIDADPKNAVCLADMALQMSLTGIEPAAGPDEIGSGEDFTPDTTPPAENPNQLNQGTGGNAASPVVPAPVLQINS